MDLNQFCSTESYHRFSPLFPRHLLTDGTKYLAEKGKAFWLMDAIASYHPKVMKNKKLREIQFWKLRVNGNKGVLTCEIDAGKAFITQRIEYTDFPMVEVGLYVCPQEIGGELHWIILLPSEY